MLNVCIYKMLESKFDTFIEVSFNLSPDEVPIMG